MSTILWIIAVIMIVGWVIGFAFLHVGGIIHALLVIAIISIVYNLITGKKAV